MKTAVKERYDIFLYNSEDDLIKGIHVARITLEFREGVLIYINVSIDGGNVLDICCNDYGVFSEEVSECFEVAIYIASYLLNKYSITEVYRTTEEHIR